MNATLATLLSLLFLQLHHQGDYLDRSTILVHNYRWSPMLLSSYYWLNEKSLFVWQAISEGDLRPAVVDVREQDLSYVEWNIGLDRDTYLASILHGLTPDHKSLFLQIIGRGSPKFSVLTLPTGQVETFDISGENGSWCQRSHSWVFLEDDNGKLAIAQLARKENRWQRSRLCVLNQQSLPSSPPLSPREWRVLGINPQGKVLICPRHHQNDTVVSLWEVDTSNSRSAPLFHKVQLPPNNLTLSEPDIILSAQGTQIAWLFQRTGKAKEDPNTVTEIWISRWDGLNMSRLGIHYGDVTDTPLMLHWLPNGKALSFIQNHILHRVEVPRSISSQN